MNDKVREELNRSVACVSGRHLQCSGRNCVYECATKYNQIIYLLFYGIAHFGYHTLLV